MSLAPVALLALLAAQPVFRPLPLGEVKPRGWLLEQLRLQAEGLSGHIEEVWPDLGPNSGWLGGSGEAWERAPYYLDGLVPLAFLLSDEVLIARARKWLDWTLEHAAPSGEFGPAREQDWWPRFVMTKALTQYQEATGDPRVVPFLERYFAFMGGALEHRPLQRWARYRWFEQLESLLWLYERDHQQSLLALARTLRGQGFDWDAHFRDFHFETKTRPGDTSMEKHGVNNAMALKVPALELRLDADARHRDDARHTFEVLDRYHLSPVGVHNADEHYAGRDPTQGFETCAVVETMFSLEELLAAFGDAAYGDRLERVAFNALPAATTEDHWGHQYDQQPNQVLCSVSKRAWVSDGPESNLFGLEPNFGCCTANLHQGWPKLASHLWMAARDGALAAVVLAPSEVHTRVAGTAVSIVEETEYPFRETVRFAIDPAAPVRFKLSLRIPGWAGDAEVRVNGTRQRAQAGTFCELDRVWKKGDRVELRLPMQASVHEWPSGGVVVERGPLVFALRVEESWRALRSRGLASDWEVFPISPWNDALVVDSGFQAEERPVARQPFNRERPPIVLHAKARRVPTWQIVNDNAGPVPAGKVVTAAAEEPVELVPYGASKLRVTVLPVTFAAAPRCAEVTVSASPELKSSPGAAASTELAIENNCLAASVQLVWVDVAGEEHGYATLAPGAIGRQSTYEGHVWRVKDAVSGALLRELRASAKSELVPACACKP